MAAEPTDPIADVAALYCEVRAISAWLTKHGRSELGERLYATLTGGGVSSLEVSGNIRFVMKELVLRRDLQGTEVVARMLRCIRFVDFIWSDPARDDNPYA